MIVFPNAKINIGLHVLGKRADGYHNLKSLFFPIPIKDALEVVPSNGRGQITFTSSGLDIPGTSDQNLCIKAYELLANKYALPSVLCHLHKSIPMGAGLGGGSADGSFMLRLLNDTFALNIDPNTLAEYALQLGSDCPYFIQNEAAIVEGRGEIIQAHSIHLQGLYYVLVHPGIHINTGQAYQQLTFSPDLFDFKRLTRENIGEWKNWIHNSFEDAVFKKYPAISAIKNKLYEAGALYAQMSGSGSAVFGLFSSAPDFSHPEGATVWSGKL